MKRTGYISIILIISICCSSFGQSGFRFDKDNTWYPVFIFLQNGLMINLHCGPWSIMLCHLEEEPVLGISNGPVAYHRFLHSVFWKRQSCAGGLWRVQWITESHPHQSVYAVYAYHIKLAKGKSRSDWKPDLTGRLPIIQFLKAFQAGDPVFEDTRTIYSSQM